MKKIIKISVIILSAIVTFMSCNNENISTTSNNENETKEQSIDYLKVGKDFAIQTKTSLSKYLTKAISEKGSEGAVEFCNTKAIPITDSMSIVLDAKIKRVSDKPRNPNNQANVAEMAFIKTWKESHAKGEVQKPIVTEINNKMVAYYPIVTNQMCMQCHGKSNKDINTATLQKIKNLYPTDQAIGYTENELRGIFVVEMNKK